MKTTISLLTLTTLAFGIAWAASLHKLEKTKAELRTAHAQAIHDANRLGFGGALYGFEAGRQGMDPQHFVANAGWMFGGTNLAVVHIQYGTNEVDVQQIEIQRNTNVIIQAGMTHPK